MCLEVERRPEMIQPGQGGKKNWQEFPEHWCCIGVVITFSELCFKYNEVASVSQNVIGEKRGMGGVASRAQSPSRT